MEFEADKTSLLAENMEQEASVMDRFPVLIGDEIEHFHGVRGGYNQAQQSDVINFVHYVEGVGSPSRLEPDQTSHDVEAHLSDNYFNLDVSAVRVVDEYPTRDYVLSLKVDSYQQGPYSFSEQMTRNIDKRERNEKL